MCFSFVCQLYFVNPCLFQFTKNIVRLKTHLNYIFDEVKMKPQKKVIITVGSQDQENVTDIRRTFKDLQRDASDKENLIGRQIAKDPFKGTAINESGKLETLKKKLQMSDKSVQVGDKPITAEDLTCDEAGVDYWKTLAETRAKSLDDSLHEIEKLKDDVGALKEENRICKEMLDESKHLVEVLQEMLSEQEDVETEETNSNA